MRSGLGPEKFRRSLRGVRASNLRRGGSDFARMWGATAVGDWLDLALVLSLCAGRGTTHEGGRGVGEAEAMEEGLIVGGEVVWRGSSE